MSKMHVVLGVGKKCMSKMHVQNEVFLWLMHVEGVCFFLPKKKPSCEYENPLGEDTRKVPSDSLLKHCYVPTCFFCGVTVYTPEI